ncbi:PQQ-binding-like beta-propeller repeat protein [Actinomadura nitritigenes]|uniref:protein kinase domain-containing protein n=1 Tax=Actinomadura nitritigenes TaxID=134602 RepID=UPI003691903B
MTEPLRPEDPETLGPHRLVGRLGQGGMGRVYLARSRAGRLLAVKAVHAEYADDPAFRARFRREIDAARRVAGAFTAPVVDADPDGSPPWLATAYVPGPSLRDAVLRHGPLPEGTVRALGAGLAEALGAVHAAGLVHRDLKPSNVLLAADGPRLIDFGVSRAMDDAALTAAGAVVGSAGYLSPEQAAADEAGPASDVFSLGATLAFAATGRPPFGDARLEVLLYRVGHEDPDLAGLPGPLRDVLAACLQRDPARRPPVGRLPALFLPEPGAAPAPAPARHWLPDPVAAEVAEWTANAANAGDGTSGGGGVGRRWLLAGLAAAGVAAAAGGVIAFASRGDSKPRPGPSAEPKVTPRRLWSARAENPDGLAIADGLVLYATGAFSADLVALDLSTGRRRWRKGGLLFADQPGGEWARPPVAASGSALYAALGSLDDGAPMRALDPATGAVRATIELPGDLGPGLVWGAQGPVVFCRSSGAVRALIAVDAASRKVLWSYQGRSAMDEMISVPPAGGLVFRTERSGTVHAHAVADGTERWQAPTDTAAGGRPVIAAGDAVYVSGGYLYALDAATGRRRWAFATGTDGRAAVRGGDVFVTLPRLTALDARTGAPRWQVEAGGTLGRLAICEDLLLAVDLDSERPAVHGWEAGTGKRRWEYPLPADEGGNPYRSVETAGDVFAIRHGSAIDAFQVT